MFVYIHAHIMVLIHKFSRLFRTLDHMFKLASSVLMLLFTRFVSLNYVFYLSSHLFISCIRVFVLDKNSKCFNASDCSHVLAKVKQ